MNHVVETGAVHRSHSDVPCSQSRPDADVMRLECAVTAALADDESRVIRTVSSKGSEAATSASDDTNDNSSPLSAQSDTTSVMSSASDPSLERDSHSLTIRAPCTRYAEAGTAEGSTRVDAKLATMVVSLYPSASSVASVWPSSCMATSAKRTSNDECGEFS